MKMMMMTNSDGNNDYANDCDDDKGHSDDKDNHDNGGVIDWTEIIIR